MVVVAGGDTVVTPGKPGPGGSYEDEHICEQDGLEDE